jgi:alpha-tubulin suppressor-like RCC1 family protein
MGFTCAITAEGAVKCWGVNYQRELGNESTGTTSLVPVEVTGLSAGVQTLSAGSNHACALTSAGRVRCWGSDNSSGNPTFGSTVPVEIAGLPSDIRAIAAGSNSTCALTRAGAVMCWGQNSRGQLGNNSRVGSTVPVNVVGLSSGVQAIAMASSFACALTVVGSVKCWGDCPYCGPSSLVPTEVPGLSSGVEAISVGVGYACAVTAFGTAKCWGSNGYGQLGSASSGSDVPIEVTGLSSGVQAISAGDYHACVLTFSGAVKCWGTYATDTLSGNPGAAGVVPTDVSGLSPGVQAISAGGDQTCALTTWGVLKCWGKNWAGALGNNSTTDSSVPVDVVSL